MNKDWDNIEFLRHVRHDWLNKIQLIKGNLALNKSERIKDIIDDIIMEAQQEARLSNLNIPHFATKLLICNWEKNHFHLEYEVLNEQKCQEIEDLTLSNWTGEFFKTLNSSIKQYHDNHLSISIEPLQNETRLFFDFSGIIEDKQLLMDYLAKEYSNSMKVYKQEITENELVLELHVSSNQQD